MYILDKIRAKYMVLTPEEWVRQAFIDYLEKQGYPLSLMQIERTIAYPHRKKRPDIVLYDREGQPFLLIECKAAHIPLDDKVLAQAQTYNWVMKAPYLAITNGSSLAVFAYTTEGLAAQTALPAYKN